MSGSRVTRRLDSTLSQGSESLGGAMREWKPRTPRAESKEELEVDTIGEQFLDRLQAGGTADRKALVQVHPEIAGVLERHLALVEMLHWARLHVTGRDLSRPA